MGIHWIERTAGTATSTAPASLTLAGFDTKVHSTIAEIPRAEWLSLFPHSPKSWDYYRAIEAIPDYCFKFGAVTVRRGGVLVGAAPLFQVDYRLDQPFGNSLRGVGGWLDRHLPSWINMPIVGLGSPLSEECHIGLVADAGTTQRLEVLRALLQAVAEHAAGIGTRVLALKDVREADRAVWAEELAAAGYSQITSLPVARLSLPFDSFDDYLASLSPKMRQDLRRKLRQSADIRVEYRDSLNGIEAETEEMVAATRARRKTSYDTFDEIPRGYFRAVMDGLGGAARLQLLWDGDTLGAVNLFIDEGERVSGKFVGMRYPIARERNLYFLNWVEMIRYCIANAKRELNVGQASYALKVRFGCKLHRSYIYHQHTGVVRGPVFRMLSPYAAFDRMDADLKALGDDAPYAIPALDAAKRL